MSELKNISLNEQTPASINSIKTKKPHVNRSYNHLTGYIGNSFNGGIMKPLAYKKVMAGEKIKRYSMNGIARMLTPAVPSAQKLTMTVDAYFVPDSRVWDAYEEFVARKGATTLTKILNYPFCGDTGSANNSLPTWYEGNGKVNPVNTSLWRDCWISSYLPRYGFDITNPATEESIKLPSINILLFRGLVAIYNDMRRHKVYDPKLTEYKGNKVVGEEKNSYFPQTPTDAMSQPFMIRGRRKDSYYTDYKTDLQGFKTSLNLDTMDVQQHAEWQKQIAESRTQSENEQLNDWDIIAKLRGTRPVKDGKIRHLGRREIPLNYTQVAQTSYNNAVTEENRQSLGVTGAYSYTEFNIDIVNYQEFIEDGFIHIVQQTSADTIFETGTHRTLLNVKWDDQYRPDFINITDDILYDVEKEGTSYATTNATKATGFKRKFSEQFTLPQLLSGEMTTKNILDTTITETGNLKTESELTTQHAFQFAETSDRVDYSISNNGQQILGFKHSWRDYTDLLINKNLAIREPVLYNEVNYITKVGGHNQIFLMAKTECITDLPIDEDIKKNFKMWGEE